ncbi:MAG: DUF4380 domain-containing protein [Anaerolineales bacterium]|nr:DUF4380 domain-containing protein [Anaerolineales bacterium]
MIKASETEFEGLSCIQLENGLLSLWLTRDVGPRILGMSLAGEENLMAVLPDLKIEVQGADDYSLRGGHRLWVAPEKPETTYIADDQPVEILYLENGLQITQDVDLATGIRKSWQVILDDVHARVSINHILTNQGNETFELAPWAITQLRPGGTGIIPLQTELADKHGLLPNRQLVLWPYTRINSPYLEYNDQAVVVKAEMETGALKVGTANPRGWLAYILERTLFVKRAVYQAGADYLDRGASSQIYCNPSFIELETLGPVLSLAPGESVDHQEIWQIYSKENWPEEIIEIYQAIRD